MSDIPNELRYSTTHEWVRLEDDGTVTVGVTEFAARALGDLVFVELPEVGSVVNAGEECGVVESVKAASDLYSPVNGEVVAVNEKLSETPELINTDAYGDGWILQIRPDDETALEELLDAEAYAEQVHSEEH